MAREPMAEDDLEPLITECPDCHTRFRVTEDHLQRARGRVRCGACLAVFDGVERLVWQAPAGFEDEEAAQRVLDDVLRELSGAPAAESHPFAVVGGSDAGAPTPAPPAVAASVSPAAAAEPAALPRGTGAAEACAVPEPTAPTPVAFGEPPKPRPWMAAAIVLAALALVAQVLWYQFEAWGDEPGWRELYAPLCRVLGCQLPAQRDLEALTTRHLTVRAHPADTGRLLVDALIVNEAEFPQPFPMMELRFTSARGALVAGRRFQPEQYLAGEAAGMELMPARTPVHIELTIDDPGPHAVNYSLKLR